MVIVNNEENIVCIDKQKYHKMLSAQTKYT